MLKLTFSPLQGRQNHVVPLSTSVLRGRKRISRSIAALRSTGSVDSTGSDFGITPVIMTYTVPDELAHPRCPIKVYAVH